MANPPNITFVEGRTEREIHRDLLTLKAYAFSLDNSIWLDPGVGLTSGTLSNFQEWPVTSHANGVSQYTRWSLYLPSAWVDANAHLEWFACEASADAGNFRIRSRVRQSADIHGVDMSALANTLEESVTDAAGAANTPKRITSSTFTITGRHLMAAFLRIGADAADTATVDLVLWGGLLVRE